MSGSIRQSNLDYLDSLGPDDILQIIKNMNINELRNWLIKKTTFSRETTLLQTQ